MEHIFQVLFFIFLFAALLALIGIIQPSFFQKYFRKPFTRRKSFGIFLVFFAVSLLIEGAFIPLLHVDTTSLWNESKSQQNHKQTIISNISITPTSALSPLAITIKTSAGNVKSGDYASETIQTVPHAICTLEVDYLSGPSHAAGLVASTALSDGMITWRWKVGTSTTKGTWPLVIRCSDDAASKQITQDTITVI